jgi:hypothetical protein
MFTFWKDYFSPSRRLSKSANIVLVRLLASISCYNTQLEWSYDLHVAIIISLDMWYLSSFDNRRVGLTNVYILERLLFSQSWARLFGQPVHVAIIISLCCILIWQSPRRVDKCVPCRRIAFLHDGVVAKTLPSLSDDFFGSVLIWPFPRRVDKCLPCRRIAFLHDGVVANPLPLSDDFLGSILIWQIPRRVDKCLHCRRIAFLPVGVVANPLPMSESDFLGQHFCVRCHLWSLEIHFFLLSKFAVFLFLYWTLVIKLLYYFDW